MTENDWNDFVPNPVVLEVNCDVLWEGALNESEVLCVSPKEQCHFHNSFLKSLQQYLNTKLLTCSLMRFHINRFIHSLWKFARRSSDYYSWLKSVNTLFYCWDLSTCCKYTQRFHLMGNDVRWTTGNELGPLVSDVQPLILTGASSTTVVCRVQTATQL